MLPYYGGVPAVFVGGKRGGSAGTSRQGLMERCRGGNTSGVTPVTESTVQAPHTGRQETTRRAHKSTRGWDRG